MLDNIFHVILFITSGTPRRKKKIVHQTAATDDKKLQSTLKKLAVNNIPGIEEVNLIKNDGSVIHFNNPKTQASLASNVFAITGHGEQKQVIKKMYSKLSLTSNATGRIGNVRSDSLTLLVSRRIAVNFVCNMNLIRNS